MYRLRWDRISYLVIVIIVAAMVGILEVEKDNGLDAMYYIKPKLILFCCLIVIAWFNLRTPREH